MMFLLSPLTGMSGGFFIDKLEEWKIKADKFVYCVNNLWKNLE